MTASDNGDGLVDSALEVAMGGGLSPSTFYGQANAYSTREIITSFLFGCQD